MADKETMIDEKTSFDKKIDGEAIKDLDNDGFRGDSREILIEFPQSVLRDICFNATDPRVIELHLRHAPRVSQYAHGLAKH